jgi:hypothetical protein
MPIRGDSYPIYHISQSSSTRSAVKPRECINVANKKKRKEEEKKRARSSTRDF